MTSFTLANHLNQALDLILKSDPKSIIIGEDIALNGGVFRITEGLFEKYPNQVI